VLTKLRVLLWTLAVRVVVRRQLGRSGLQRITLPRAPRVGAAHAGKVDRVLTATRTTCLTRSIVMQRFLADNGDEIDILIGATAPSAGFRAHAWLARPVEANAGEGLTVMMRLSPQKVAEGVLPRGVL
jgi:hypothetical protein